MVKNCRAFRIEYTRPCIATGICVQQSVQIGVHKGTVNQPRTAPRHQMERFFQMQGKSSLCTWKKAEYCKITRVRLFGAGKREAAILPTKVAIPVKVLTIPSAVELPPVRGKQHRGQCRFIDRGDEIDSCEKRIKSRIPRFSCKKWKPFLAACQNGSGVVFSPCEV